MLSINNLKNGVVIDIDSTPFEVVKYQHIKQARGGAMLKTTLKNLLSGNNIEKTFRGDEKIQPADIGKSKAQFLYRQGGDFVFMDSETFEQFTIPATTIGFLANFMRDGQVVDLVVFNGNPINASLPAKMPFKVTEAEPAVKGDSANNPMKNIKIETGFELKTPMFINLGDTIIVDTRDGTYIERGK